MLIRFTLENFYSFNRRKEFTMIPYSRLGTLSHHKYQNGDVEVLKMASIYGANGAGKSNLIKSIGILKSLVLHGKMPFGLDNSSFKFNTQETRNQVLAIEFIEQSKPFLYAIELMGDTIVTEELYLSGLGKSDDKLIYERKTDKNNATTLKFSDDFENDAKSQIMKEVLIEDFISHNSTIFKLLSNRDNKYLKDIKIAFNWFSNTLHVITPETKPNALVHLLDSNSNLKNYAEKLMASFNIGITSLDSEKMGIKEFFGENDEIMVEDILQQLDESETNMLSLTSARGDQLIISKDEGKVWIKRLKVGHKGLNDKTVLFDLEEESDGTIRLLDFIPAFQSISTKESVFIVDEIERSIHPLLIKELVKKFSEDEKSKGQLIFTTHESNLLDQSIFRKDEIWFVEKDESASSDIYSLNDYKEHNTTDIRKGYLNGRYGGIPFLANLSDLKWNTDDINK
jgi:AAA15 family ATPase/GTPase